VFLIVIQRLLVGFYLFLCKAEPNKGTAIETSILFGLDLREKDTAYIFTNLKKIRVLATANSKL
jgi:hypothetical protein